MDVQPRSIPSTSLSPAALWSGYAGLAPFAASLAVLWLAPQPEWRELALRLALAYGAVILTFVGALHWAFALSGRLPGAAAIVIASITPAVVATAALLLGGLRGIALLVVGVGLFWLYEHRRCGNALPADYLALRRSLSIGVCALLTLIMFAADAAGLR